MDSPTPPTITNQNPRNISKGRFTHIGLRGVRASVKKYRFPVSEWSSSHLAVSVADSEIKRPLTLADMCAQTFNVASRASVDGPLLMLYLAHFRCVLFPLLVERSARGTQPSMK